MTSKRYGVAIGNSRRLLAAVTAAGMLAMAPGMAGAAEGKSAVGKPQEGAKAYATKGAGMPADAKLKELKGAELDKALVPASKLDLSPALRNELNAVKTKRMQDVLKAAPRITNELGSPTGVEGQGGQSGGPREGGGINMLSRKRLKALASQKHLQLTLKIKDDGSSEILSAVELPGPAPTGPKVLRGDFVAEVAKGAQTLAVDSFQDPFELRGVNDPKLGHFIGHTEEAILQVFVPADLGTVPSDLSVRLLKIKPGAEIHEFDKNVLLKLRQEGRLQTIARGENLAPKIQEKAIKLPLDKGIQLQIQQLKVNPAAVVK